MQITVKNKDIFPGEARELLQALYSVGFFEESMLIGSWVMPLYQDAFDISYALRTQDIDFAVKFVLVDRREKAASDIDLMIIGEPNTSRLNEKIIELENILKREINQTIYSLKEYKAKKKAKSGFMLDLLKKPKIMLIGKENDIERLNMLKLQRRIQ